MWINKGIKIIAVGSLIGLGNLSTYSVSHTSAVEIAVPEGSTSLSSLTIEEFQLDQTFSADVTEYAASVLNDVKSMSLLLKTEDEGAVLAVNGQTVTSGVMGAYSLEIGENSFIVTVTNDSQVSTYTLSIIRDQNENNQLAKLTLSSGELIFDSKVTNYNVNVQSEIKAITVTPETEADTSVVEVNGIRADSEGVTVDLPVGKTTITIIVTAESGSQKTYNVMVTRATQKTLNSKPVTPSESKSDEKLPTTKPISAGQDDPSLFKVSGGKGESSSISLPVGSMGEELGAKTTANLAALTVSSGTWNKTFASGEYTYHLEIASDVTSVTILADADESDAELVIGDGDSSTVTIGAKPRTVIPIVVTHDEERKTYLLVFDKHIDEKKITEKAGESESVVDAKDSESSKTLATNTENRNESNQMTKMGNKPAQSNTLWQRIKTFFGF